MKARINKCAECKEAIGKYRFPCCRAFYCSVICFKAHSAECSILDISNGSMPSLAQNDNKVRVYFNRFRY